MRVCAARRCACVCSGRLCVVSPLCVGGGRDDGDGGGSAGGEQAGGSQGPGDAGGQAARWLGTSRRHIYLLVLVVVLLHLLLVLWLLNRGRVAGTQ